MRPWTPGGTLGKNVRTSTEMERKREAKWEPVWRHFALLRVIVHNYEFIYVLAGSFCSLGVVWDSEKWRILLFLLFQTQIAHFGHKCGFLRFVAPFGGQLGSLFGIFPF